MEYIGDILYDEALLQEGKRFVIFGAGVYGQKVLQYLEQNGFRNNVICFCDSNHTKKEQEIEGILVRQTKEAFRLYPDAEYLISGNYMKEMYQCLKEASIGKIHFLWL